MKERRLNRISVAGSLLIFSFTAIEPQDQTQDIDKAIEKGIDFLLNKTSNHKKGSLNGFWETYGMEVYAMAQCGVKKDKLNEYIQKNISGPLSKETRDASMIYSLGLMALVGADPEKFKTEIGSVTDKLLKCQKACKFPYPNMPFTYPQMYPYNPYPYLALYVASEWNNKLVPDDFWVQAEKFFKGCQNGDGTWKYHMGTFGTHACAGAIIVGLAKLKQNKKLVPRDFASDGSIAKTLSWLDKNFAPDKNPQASGMYNDSYYFIYVAGIVATLTGRDKFGKHDWWQEGAKHILSSQKEDGSWLFTTRGHSDVLLDTAFAMMFLKKHFIVKWPEKSKE